MTSSSIGLTYAGAPPCSGPERAPTAAESAAPQSAPVEATTRAVNVDAFTPCSAVQIQYVSIALTALGSPRHATASRNRSAAVCPARTVSAGTSSSCPSASRADWATIDIIWPGEAAEILLGLVVGDLVQLAELPHAATAARSAPGDRPMQRPVMPTGSKGSGSGMPRVDVVVDEEAPDVLVRELADQRLDVDAAVAERAALLSGSMISVSTATTPSRPGLNSCCSCVNLLQLDLLAGAAFPRGREHERRGGEVLDGDADRLVQRDLLAGAAPDSRPGDDLAELDDAVAAARLELRRAGRERRECRVALLPTTTSACATIAGSSSEPPGP